MQVLLLLKSSDRVVHDICHAFDGCPEVPGAPIAHTLALRRWVALKPQRELRCFVRQTDLIGVQSLYRACAVLSMLERMTWYFLGVPPSASAVSRAAEKNAPS